MGCAVRPGTSVSNSRQVLHTKIIITENDPQRRLALKLQCQYWGIQGRKLASSLRADHDAAIIIQKHYRSFHAQTLFHLQKHFSDMIVLIQNRMRIRISRNVAHKMRTKVRAARISQHRKKLDRAAKNIQSVIRSSKIRAALEAVLMQV